LKKLFAANSYVEVDTVRGADPLDVRNIVEGTWRLWEEVKGRWQNNFEPSEEDVRKLLAALGKGHMGGSGSLPTEKEVQQATKYDAWARQGSNMAVMLTKVTEFVRFTVAGHLVECVTDCTDAHTQLRVLSTALEHLQGRKVPEIGCSAVEPELQDGALRALEVRMKMRSEGRSYRAAMWKGPGDGEGAWTPTVEIKQKMWSEAPDSLQELSVERPLLEAARATNIDWVNIDAVTAQWDLEIGSLVQQLRQARSVGHCLAQERPEDSVGQSLAQEGGVRVRSPDSILWGDINSVFRT
jgi:hypothetical protein